MADLSAMYMNLANNTGRATERGFLGAQQMMENQLAYQKAKEDMEAQRGLRALFQQNPNATPEDVSRYSPQFGMEMVKAQQEGQERAGRMQKTRNEISEQEMKIFSIAGAQVAEKYADAALSGQMTPEMLSQFHNDIGNATMQVEQQYGIRPPPGIDISRLDPIGVLTRAAPYYKSPLLENQAAFQREQMLSQVPPRMSAEQAYGGVDMGPYGPRLKPPLPRVNPPRNQPPQTDLSGMSLADGDTGETVPLKAENLPRLEQIYNKIPDVNLKSKVGTYLNQLKQQGQQPQESQQSQFVTPQQEAELRVEEERQKKAIESQAAGEKKSAELGAETAEETAKKAATLNMLPSDEKIYDLIKKSVSGNIERRIKGSALSEEIGYGTEANTATAELTSIQEIMRSVVKSLYTPGAITKDEQDKMQSAIGNIAQTKDADSRIAAYRRFMDMTRKSLVNHPELANEVERITGSKVLSPRRKLNKGDTVGNLRYKGGDPYSESNWEQVR